MGRGRGDDVKVEGGVVGEGGSGLAVTPDSDRDALAGAPVVVGEADLDGVRAEAVSTQAFDLRGRDRQLPHGSRWRFRRIRGLAERRLRQLGRLTNQASLGALRSHLWGTLAARVRRVIGAVGARVVDCWARSGGGREPGVAARCAARAGFVGLGQWWLPRNLQRGARADGTDTSTLREP